MTQWAVRFPLMIVADLLDTYVCIENLTNEKDQDGWDGVEYFDDSASEVEPFTFSGRDCPRYEILNTQITMNYLRRNPYKSHQKTTSTMVANSPAMTATNTYAIATRPHWSLPLVLYQTTPWFGAKILRDTIKNSVMATKAANNNQKTKNQA